MVEHCQAISRRLCDNLQDFLDFQTADLQYIAATPPAARAPIVSRADHRRGKKRQAILGAVYQWTDGH